MDPADGGGIVSTPEPLFLGLDAGGTGTRWALANTAGEMLREGAVAGLTALMMGNAAGRDQMLGTASALAGEVAAQGLGAPMRIAVGITGYSDDPVLAGQMQTLFGGLFSLPAESVSITSDIVIAYHAAFEPGQGYLVYAGTGSIGAHVDGQGRLHRVGGLGSLLGDGGSGHWIACEAMRHIWRQEDEQPGRWRDSPLALAVFAHVGGNQWTRSRDFIYQSSRGEVGTLALAVAATVDTDPVAHRILWQAGTELAQLGMTLTRRFGPKPMVLAGRALDLHPLIEQGVHATLPQDMPVSRKTLHPHRAAARLAAQGDQVLAHAGPGPPPASKDWRPAT